MCLSLVLYHSVSKADSYHTPTVDIVLIRLGIQNILTNIIYWKANVRAHEVLAIVTQDWLFQYMSWRVVWQLPPLLFTEYLQ